MITCKHQIHIFNKIIMIIMSIYDCEDVTIAYVVFVLQTYNIGNLMFWRIDLTPL